MPALLAREAGERGVTASSGSSRLRRPSAGIIATGRTSTEPSSSGIVFAQLERRIQVVDVDEVVAGELLLGLGERAVDDHGVALPASGGWSWPCRWAAGARRRSSGRRR